MAGMQKRMSKNKFFTVRREVEVMVTESSVADRQNVIAELKANCEEEGRRRKQDGEQHEARRAAHYDPAVSAKRKPGKKAKSDSPRKQAPVEQESQLVDTRVRLTALIPW
jgi:hypothetical protein